LAPSAPTHGLAGNAKAQSRKSKLHRKIDVIAKPSVLLDESKPDRILLQAF
jgi:hypothetical protein